MKIEEAKDAWQLMPHTFAHRISQKQFKLYPHIGIISKKIAHAIASGNGRLIIELPPRHGKSELISKWLPVWYLNHFPKNNIILCSYESGFAAHWGRQVRNIIENSNLKIKLSQDSTAAHRFHTAQGGSMMTAGVGGPITGRGGHLLLIDDPIKNWEEASSKVIRDKQIDWFKSTFYSRKEPNATIIVLMQRWHQGDLAGWLQKEHTDQWEVIRMPAIAEENDVMGRVFGDALCPERYDAEALEKIKKSVGSYFWSALYQQRPSPLEGSIVKKSWLRFYDQCPELTSLTQFWDLPFKGTKTSDFAVGTLWGLNGPNYYLKDLVRGRWNFPQTIHQITSFSHLHKNYTVVIEDKANGPAVIDTLRQNLSCIIPYDPTGSKEARLMAVSPLFEGGNVYLPKSAWWLDDYIEELCGFPNMPNDDQVDSTTMALLRLRGASAPRVWNLD